jgi:hypothetical protein
LKAASVAGFRKTPATITTKNYHKNQVVQKVIFSIWPADLLDLILPSARILPAATCQNHTIALLLPLLVLLCHSS